MDFSIYDGVIGPDDIFVRCPRCDDETWIHISELYQYYNNIDAPIACPQCNTLVEFGSTKCSGCFVDMSIYFWKTIYDDMEFEEDYVDEMYITSGDNLVLLEKIRRGGKNITLCCNDYEQNCDCHMPLYWMDAWEAMASSTEDPYEYHSKCSGCVHFCLPTCIPLRESLFSFVELGEDLKPINGCNNYEPENFSILANQG